MRIRWGKTYVTLRNSHQFMAKLSAVLPFFRRSRSSSDTTAVSSQFPMQLLQELATALPPLQLPVPPTTTTAAAAAAASAVRIAEQQQPLTDATTDTSTTDAATGASNTTTTAVDQRKRSLSMPLPPPLTLVGADNNTSWVGAQSIDSSNSSSTAIAAAAAAAVVDDNDGSTVAPADAASLSNSSSTSDTVAAAATATGSATAATGVLDSPADTKLLGLAEHAVATAMAELFAMHGPLETPNSSSNGFNGHSDVGRALSGVEEGETEHDVTDMTVTDSMNSTV
jgi:hypothetical protein